MLRKIYYKGAVYPWHCDIFGHMNVQFYMAKFDEAAWNFLAELDFTVDYFKNERKGLAAIEHKINYHKELFAGQTVSIKGRLIEYGEKTITFELKMYENQNTELAAEIKTKVIMIDLDRRKTLPLKEEEKDRLDKFLMF
jgi:acyl-CoA thioester hydrolase